MCWIDCLVSCRPSLFTVQLSFPGTPTGVPQYVLRHNHRLAPNVGASILAGHNAPHTLIIHNYTEYYSIAMVTNW